MPNDSADYIKRDVWISKTLSWLLRHGAIKEGLSISSDGFVSVTDILNCKCLKSKCSLEDLKRVVENNEKQRFALRSIKGGVLQIRANQGHSLAEIAHLELVPITNHTQFKNVIHGTYCKHWNIIKVEGLHRRKRNHIHFAIGLPGSTGVISGIRKTAEIYIYIDIAKALSAGISFFLSTNNVILSSGDSDGYIRPTYFLKVYRAKDGIELKY